MVLRFLIRFLGNNERLIQMLADSYPIRKAARLTTRFILRAKSYREEAIESIKKNNSYREFEQESHHAGEKIANLSETLKKSLQNFVKAASEKMKRPR